MIKWYNIYEGRKENKMVEVKCDYINEMSKTKKDYFIYLDVEVKGHASNNDYTTNNRVCAGISACCYGIKRLIDEGQFNIEIGKGYFHCWTNRIMNLKSSLDKDSVYALNTLVCQLYEIYLNYPKAFKSFDLVDVKEKIENERKKRNEQQWGGQDR